MTRNDAEHQEWENRLARMGQVIRKWAERIALPPPAVQSGSSLHADDREYKPVTVSGVSWYSITTAVEHLDFTIENFRATHTLYPSAHLTVLRTALITGSIAVWVLSPKKRRERQLRALNVEADELANTLAAINGMKMQDSKQEASIRRARDSVADQQAALQVVANSLGGPDDICKWRLNTTSIVEAAGRSVYDDEPVLTTGVGLLWRRGSAAAHGARSVVTMGLNPDNLRRSDEGVLYATATGDLARDVGPLAVAAFQMTSEAFGMYDTRRINHLP